MAGGTGNYANVLIGHQAGYLLNGSTSQNLYNCFVGSFSGSAMTTGAKNTILGSYSGNQGGLDIRTASNRIVLSDGDGNPRLWIDNFGNVSVTEGVITALAGYNNTTASGANVNVNTNGTYLRSTSALKYKTNVRDLPLIDINKFRPVVYNSKCEGDDQSQDHFGIIADEVDEAGITELVSYGSDGEVEGFQYERLTVVLLKAIQDLQARIEVLENK
jgi:hypothetical protein